MNDDLHECLQLYHEPVVVHSKATDAIGRMLSNFYPCEIAYGERVGRGDVEAFLRVYPSVEHAYHAMKAGDDDLVQREQFRDVFSRFGGNDLFCGEDGANAKDAAGRIWNMQGGRSAENWRLCFHADEKGALIRTDSKSRPRMQWTMRPRKGWLADVHLPTMRELLRLKFAIPEFREALLGTGRRPLNHTGDPFWGIGSKKQRRPGENMHGVLLMELREEILYGREATEYI